MVARLSMNALAELEMKVCNVLGIRPEDVKALTFHMEAGELPMVTVERHVREDHAEALGAALQTYSFEVKRAEERGKES